MGFKAVMVSAEFIEQFLVTGAEHRATRVLEGIPEGSKLVGVRPTPNPLYGLRLSGVELIFTHESFPQAEPNVAPELMDIRFETCTALAEVK